MILGKVIGNVVATVKHPQYVGEKLLMVIPIDAEGNSKGTMFVAVDIVQAGPGDRVLVMTEGNSARKLLENNNSPANTVIVGIVDEIEVSPNK